MGIYIGDARPLNAGPNDGNNTDSAGQLMWNNSSGSLCPPAPTGMGFFRSAKAGPWDATVGCVDWQRNQWEASFKDVPFAVDSDVRAGGRRIHVHEFPNRESWVNEDLGRLRQQISVEGYVYGDQSDLWAEMLFAACTQAVVDNKVASEGMLYLPMRVPLLAVCQSVESTFNATQMGRIDFSIQFSIEPFEYNEALSPVPTSYLSAVMLASAVRAATMNNIRLAMRRFDALFTGTQPSVARQAAGEIIRATGRMLHNAASQVRLNEAAGSIVEFVSSRFISDWPEYADMQRTSINTMNRTAAVLSQRASGLSYYQQAMSGLAIRASTGEILPATGDMGEGFAGMLWNALAAMRSGSPKTVQNSSDLAAALVPMTNLKPQTSALSATQLATASVQAEIALAETVAALVRRMGLSYSIQAAVDVAPAKQPDASLTRTRLLEQIDEEIERLAGVGGHQQALREVRTSVVKFVNHYSAGGQASKELPASYAGKPLAVIAASVYGNNAEGRDMDLMRFNGVTHPMFAPTAMVALTDGSMTLTSGI